MKKVSFLSIVLFFALLGFLSSCSNDENFEALKMEFQKKELDQRSSDFKNVLVTSLKESKTRSPGILKLNQSQLDSLRSLSLNVLKEFGYSDEELKEFSTKDDQRLILLGAFVVGVSETNHTSLSDDDACYDADKAMNCIYTTIKDAIGLTLAEEIWNSVKAYRCLTKKILKEAIRQGLKKVPGISVISIIYSYSSCMGWI